MTTRSSYSDRETMTLGELIQDMNAGRVTREQVIEAMKPLTVICWAARVSRPEPVADHSTRHLQGTSARRSGSRAAGHTRRVAVSRRRPPQWPAQGPVDGADSEVAVGQPPVHGSTREAGR